MNNIKKVFQKEEFIVPDYTNINLIDLVRMLYKRFGVNFTTNDNMREIETLIPQKKHTVLILIDGMGSNLVQFLDSNSILKSNKKRDLLTVSPSTTGCVLTSLVTGEYPSTHGMIGWYSYNREYDIDYYPLLFADRIKKIDLSEYHINASDIYKTKSVLSCLNVSTKVLYPDYICDSKYSKFVATDDKRYGYSSFEDAFQKINEILNSEEKSFTYLYIPDIDNLEHDYGVTHKLVIDKINEIEFFLNKLKNKEDCVTVVTADHGQIDIDYDVVMDFKKYGKYFYAYPGIDFGTATYYVKEEYYKEFESLFQNEFSERMYLFKTENFINENIFGLDEINKYMKDNLGEYISVTKKGYCFVNSLEVDEYFGKTKGNHSGFSNEEMIIPLIVID